MVFGFPHSRAGKSALGEFLYEPVDTKLASVGQPKHALQLAVYGRLLAEVQGRLPERLHIVVGSGDVETVRTAELHYYADVARRGLEAFADDLPTESGGDLAGTVVIAGGVSVARRSGRRRTT